MCGCFAAIKWRKGKNLCLHLTRFVTCSRLPSSTSSRKQFPILPILSIRTLTSHARASFLFSTWQRLPTRQRTAQSTDLSPLFLILWLTYLYQPFLRQDRKSNTHFTLTFSTKWMICSIIKMIKHSIDGDYWVSMVLKYQTAPTEMTCLPMANRKRDSIDYAKIRIIYRDGFSRAEIRNGSAGRSCAENGCVKLGSMGSPDTLQFVQCRISLLWSASPSSRKVTQAGDCTQSEICLRTLTEIIQLRDSRRGVRHPGDL